MKKTSLSGFFSMAKKKNPSPLQKKNFIAVNGGKKT